MNVELPQFEDPARRGAASAADHQLNDPIQRIQVIDGDIAKLDPALGVQAIVNAANEALIGGGGVDGAIHKAAGEKQLLEYNKQHHADGCPTGLAVRTPAFDLEKQGVWHIFHAVGPVWPDDSQSQTVPGAPIDDSAKLGYTYADTLLASCYMQIFKLAVDYKIEHLAIPAISTGVYRFPKDRAARIAFGHAHGHLLRNEYPRKITFVCYSPQDTTYYREAIDTRGQWMVNRGRV